MAGAARAHVINVKQVSIHGDIYYDATVLLEENPAAAGGASGGPHSKPVGIRIANHLCSRPPIAGDTVKLTFLMGQVNGVEFVQAAKG
jgi:hypothetical protein